MIRSVTYYFRSFAIIVFIVTVFTVGCSAEKTMTSTSSYISVIEKGYSEDYKETWIIAVNPEIEESEIKIIVEEPMVWNLIEVDKTYFSSYLKEVEKASVLIQISHLGDDDTLR
ncbi:hypothetical protein [Alkalihalobacterium elongatum]|uniref:hypothetical protein n=1 Tax=Alkalihalobacterium elongatum TaxID=2675466 RepID=UPI001C1F9F53|nr:hypothetical protein [Alkalihalobacterium elongatum]